MASYRYLVKGICYYVLGFAVLDILWFCIWAEEFKLGAVLISIGMLSFAYETDNGDAGSRNWLIGFLFYKAIWPVLVIVYMHFQLTAEAPEIEDVLFELIYPALIVGQLHNFIGLCFAIILLSTRGLYKKAFPSVYIEHA